MNEVLHGIIYTLIALVLLTEVGNWACRRVFALAGFKNSKNTAESKEHPAGWIIGWLERLIIAVGLAVSSWEVLAAVIALKSVARFKDLDKQKFAEYFLVGSLFSILWTLIITNAWLAYDNQFGVGIRTIVREMIEENKPLQHPSIKTTKAASAKPPAVKK
jgi:hypothetical protein